MVAHIGLDVVDNFNIPILASDLEIFSCFGNRSQIYNTT